MDPVLRKLQAMTWPFADQDHAALDELARRIAVAGRQPGGMLTYSELVEGVTFCIPAVNGGDPYRFDTAAWSFNDRRMIGDFLGRIGVDSYTQGECFASSLVIGFVANQPGEAFWELARDSGLLRSYLGRMEFWLDQIERTRAWYATSPS